MSNKLFLIAIACAAAAVSQAQQIPAEAAAAMAQAMAALGQAANQNAAAGAVDAKALRALLPGKDAFPGFKRVKASTESNAMMGFNVVVAKAEFEALEGDAGFTVQYSDIGGIQAIAKMALAMEIDEETEDGFKRTTTIDGFKAMEEYDGEDRTSEIQLFAGDRVSVSVEAHGMSFEAAKQIVAKLDLKKLAALKAEAAPAAGAK